MKKQVKQPEWGETEIVRKNDIVRHYGICATAVDKRIKSSDFPKTVFPRINGVPLLFYRSAVEAYFRKHPVKQATEVIPPLVTASEARDKQKLDTLCRKTERLERLVRGLYNDLGIPLDRYLGESEGKP